MNKIPTTHTTMRHIILPLLLVGAVSGLADAASTGVRIHRIGDAPLPPRELDYRPAASYRKRPTPPNRLAKPIPHKATTQPAAEVTHLPLAPVGHAPVVAPPPAPAAAPAPVAPPPAPAVAARPVPPPVAKPAPVAAPQPPVVKPAPVAAPQQPAPAPAKRRRRLPIAPVAVADGSTDLPPVPTALLAH